MKSTLCPCNSKKSYLICCAPYHKGKLQAPTAEVLMRSRYSAYVTNNIQYIYRTWDKDARPPLKVLREDNTKQFIHLEMIKISKGDIHDITGTVEFVASYIIQGKTETYKHHENSYFVKNNNKWKYVNELTKIDLDKALKI